MGLAADLVASVAGLPALEARRVEVGPRFFGVAPAEEGTDQLLTVGAAFLGAHQRSAPERVESAVVEARRRTVNDVTRWLEGSNEGAVALVRTALGAAALNALLTLALRRNETPLGEENGLDLLARHAAGKRLAVVGRFPYLDEIRARAARSWILELEPEDDESPSTSAPEIVPQADVVGITGSTLANGTLEGLLRLCRRDAFVVVIGPSTPLSPVLFDYGATALCGVVATDPGLALDSIVNEGSTRRIPGTRPVSLGGAR